MQHYNVMHLQNRARKCWGSWESASALPSDLIQEYEDGLQREVLDATFSSGGETIHSYSTCTGTSGDDSTLSSKKPKLDYSTGDTR